jgi:hypothetical protein
MTVMHQTGPDAPVARLQEPGGYAHALGYMQLDRTALT